MRQQQHRRAPWISRALSFRSRRRWRCSWVSSASIAFSLALKPAAAISTSCAQHVRYGGWTDRCPTSCLDGGGSCDTVDMTSIVDDPVPPRRHAVRHHRAQRHLCVRGHPRRLGEAGRSRLCPTRTGSSPPMTPGWPGQGCPRRPSPMAGRPPSRQPAGSSSPARRRLSQGPAPIRLRIRHFRESRPAGRT